MTVLRLTNVWLWWPATGDTFSAYTTDRSQQYRNDGGVENHAGGRQRAYSVEGEAGQYSVTFRNVTLADVVLLRSRKGQTVLLRDRRGQALYGTFFEVVPIEWKDSVRYDAQVTLDMVTVVEGV